MLKTLIDIITSLGIVDGKLSAMTENQLDEFARNIPQNKISCNVFGIGGYDRTDSGVLRKQVRICLLRQMPVNFDLGDVDLQEVEMSTKLMNIVDALENSPFINIENPTEITPELLKYDRTVLLTYFDVALFGNASTCGDSPCIPEFFNTYVVEKFAEINQSVDDAEAAEVAAELAQSLSEDARDLAQSYAAGASNSADAAKDSEDAALISENNAGGFADDAQGARDKAEQWAENPEDVEVEAGKYSALHHAAKAEDAADGLTSALEKINELSPIYWDADNNTFSFPVPDGGNIQINQEPHDYYTNLQGAQIVNGDIVSIIGAAGNRTAIALTDATNDAKALSCFGMVTVETIGNNNVGRITKSGGKVRWLNTAGYFEGTTIYVDPANPGKWTATKPVAPLRAIQIGTVSVSHAVEGVVELFVKVYPKFGELADVDGTTPEVLDAETIPVKKADGLIKFLSWANIKATLKAYFDTLYHAKLAYTPENIANKQNSLAVDGTGVKFPTVDAVNEGLSGKITEDAIYKVLQIGGSGLVTLKPTTSYFTYRLNVTANMTLNIDLSRMIQQVGSARCRLIIDMPIVRTITITKPVLWGGTMPTFAAAGQYIFEIIDVDGSGTPLIWLVASTTKVEQTGVILYVDSTGADYTVGQINGETATRTTSTWAAPFKYLQNAINAASSGDIIFVKQGVHKPTHLRATPTSYTDGDHLTRNATFTPKNGVDIYGGFVGTESKTWQRVVDDNGHMVNQTILCGDVLNEAVIDEAITVGDRRTTLSKANAAYHVVYSSGITSLTYINGVTLRYGNADGSGVDADGGGMRSAANFVAINCIATNNTATVTGGGWYLGTNVNCIANNNTGLGTGGGGWRDGTNTNCIAINNTATSGGGWLAGTNTNCIAINNTATSGGGCYSGTNTNCIATNNTATVTGGGWYFGTNVNCTGINNRATQAVFSSASADTNINCLLFNNKNASNVAVGFDDKTASGVKKFLCNAYDVAHPTITGGAGSEINTATCIQNLTAEQAKIEVPSFVGNATTPEQLAELEQYVKDIPTKLKPKLSSILKGAGIRRAEVSANDFNGDERLDPCTIGAIEGE